MDWKLKLMQVLDSVGEAEGIWFDPWDGVTEEEHAEIEREYNIYKFGPEATMKNKWIPFWFEGNLAWGNIDSPAEWEKITDAYTGECNPISGKRNEISDRPYFGFRAECMGGETILGWAKKLNHPLINEAI